MLSIILVVVFTFPFMNNASAFELNNNYVSMGFGCYSEYLKTLNNKSSVTVAVIDSGISEIDILKGKLIDGASFITHDDETLGETEDNTHGTFVAGLIADITSDLPVYIMPVRVMMNKSGSVNQIAEGIRYAVDNGADVINISINGETTQCTVLDEAVEYADENNVIVVVAAGNEHTELTKNNCPSHNLSTIVVSSVDEDCLFAKDFSNYGVPIDCCAPGKYINSFNGNGEKIYRSGTSFSAAFISAGVAMMKLQYSDYTDEEIQTKLKSICNDIYPYGKDVYYGYGLPDFSKLIPSSGNIKNYQAELSVDYHSNTTLHAEVDMPFDYRVKWYVNESFYSDGEELEIDKISQSTEIYFVAESEEGYSITSEKEIITVNHNILCRIIAFFRMIFGTIPEYVDNIKLN